MALGLAFLQAVRQWFLVRFSSDSKAPPQSWGIEVSLRAVLRVSLLLARLLPAAAFTLLAAALVLVAAAFLIAAAKLPVLALSQSPTDFATSTANFVKALKALF